MYGHMTGMTIQLKSLKGKSGQVKPYLVWYEICVLQITCQGLRSCVGIHLFFFKNIQQSRVFLSVHSM